MYVPEGFFGQRLRVLPRPLVEHARSEPVLRRLMVTDAGWFPHAAAHGRARPRGARESIVILCMAGSGWAQIADAPPFRVDKGMALVIPTGIPHAYHADDEDPWTIWWLHLIGDDVADLVDGALGPERKHVVPVGDVYLAVESIDAAIRALEQDDTPPMLLVAAGAAWRLMTLLIASRLRGQTDANDRIHHVQEYLRNNLATAFTIPQLAGMAGLSSSHFSALFKATVGTSVLEYLKRLRSARARELLLTSTISIAEVA